MAKQSQSKPESTVDKKYLYQPGQSGNPAGRPAGTRNKLSERYLARLAAHFEEHGLTAIERVFDESPRDYLTLVSKLIPKTLIADLTVGNGALDLDANRRARIAEEWICSREESGHG